MSTAEYTISPARYRQGAVIVKPTPSGSGWKTRAFRLAENCGTWTHRDGGYSMSPARAALFEKLFAAGWDGKYFGGLTTPDGKDWEGNHNPPPVNGYSRPTRVKTWPTFPPTIDEMIAALRRGGRIRYRVPANVPSVFKRKECDVMCATPDRVGFRADVLLVGVGPKGVQAWARCGNTFWASDDALRDLFLNGLLEEGCNPRIVWAPRPRKAIAA